MGKDEFPALSEQEYQDFLRDMDRSRSEEPAPSDADMDAMYEEHRRHWGEKLSGKSPDEILSMMEREAVPEEFARAEASGYVQAGVAEAEERYGLALESIEADCRVFEEQGVRYGGAIPAFEESRLSGYRAGESLDERTARVEQDKSGRLSDIVTEAFDARRRAERMGLAQRGFELFDETAMQTLNRLGLRDMERSLSADKSLEAGGSRIRFDAQRPAEGSVSERAVRTPAREHKERNADRLPRANNYTPAGVTVYNRAIPNDGWSFDEFDTDDGPRQQPGE